MAPPLGSYKLTPHFSVTHRATNARTRADGLCFRLAAGTGLLVKPQALFVMFI